ncbi:MAG TPA: DUF1697 domain-containing protein [Gemmatimonadales bacterium]|jgi:uncharacterized protein (DUF1697 family)
MATYVALLRAINVGGTGKLAMADLKQLCIGAGFTEVATYIASGNVVFRSKLRPRAVKGALEKCLFAHMGSAIDVFIRTGAEMQGVVSANPFRTKAGNLTYVHFLDNDPPKDALARVAGQTDEVIRLGTREIFVYYPAGMGKSTLRIPAAKAATARNMNTVARLAELSAS